jgi:hypothetical protein
VRHTAIGGRADRFRAASYRPRIIGRAAGLPGGSWRGTARHDLRPGRERHRAGELEIVVHRRRPTVRGGVRQLVAGAGWPSLPWPHHVRS